MQTCEDCGCRVYNGACTNCHEVLYIEQQYHDLDMDMSNCSDEFMGEIETARDDVYRKQMRRGHE